MERWWQDLRYAARLLIRKPAFTLVAVLSLALGIGANTAIFTVINAVFLHPLAIEDPSHVVELFTKDNKTVQTGNFSLTPSSFQNYEDYRDQNQVFTGLAASFGLGLQWTRNGETQGVPGMLASGNYFDLLGIRPLRGRLFTPDDDSKPGGSPVAVVSYSLWTREFGSDPALVGKTLTLNGMPFTVIGITPEGFKGTFSLAGPDRIWVPLSMREQLTTGQLRALMTNRRFRWLNMMGRLKPGVTLERANAAMKTIASALEKQYPEANEGRTIELARESDAALGINGRSQLVLAGSVLMAVVGLVLLIACANLANLLLAQAATREREISVRSAMGASRGRIMRQLLTESVLLAGVGGCFGIVVAAWGRTALWSFRPPFLGNASIDLSFDPRVLGFTAGITLLTGLLFGLMPAVSVSRANLNEVLKTGGRSGGAGAGNRMRGALVVSEIALATVALIGAGLFVRSMQAAQNADLGFDSTHIGFVGLSPGQQRYDQPRGEQLYLDAIARARAVPGVESAAVASSPPLTGGILLTVFPEGEAQNPNYRGSLVQFNQITPGYFDTMRIAFHEGRDFTDFDRAQSGPPVAIVNEALARQLWPGQDALHKRFMIIQQTMLFEVVGVVATSVIGAVGESPTPMIYRPMQQDYAPAAALLVRTSGDPDARLGAVREQVQTLDRNMPLRGVGTVRQNIDAGLWAPRMGAALLSIFGGLALMLAMIGVYGVMSYSVTQRSPELGVRMALGAQTGDVLRLVLKQGMALAVGGAALGLIVALSLGRVISSLLFGVSGRDPVTLVGVVAALTFVALVACYLPAYRASRIDPMTALREE